MLGLQSCISMRLISLNCENKSVCNDCHNTSEVNSLNRHGNNPSSGGRSGNAKKGILEKYPKCFRGVGLFPGEYHIDLKQDAEPVIHPPRRVPESMKEAVKKELSRMIDIDIIEKVDQPTDWVNSVVYVTKPSGELRICLDPKDLNTCVRRPHHYTQVLEDILPQPQGASVFTILDARSGYWNVKLEDESKLLTTFNTPYRRYCFRRLPFGLISAQDVFQKKVDQTFEDLPGVIAIAIIVVFGKTEAEHDKHLDDVMKRTQQVGLCLNPDKCVVKSDRIKFFGNYLSSNGLEPDPDKIAAIVDMSAPTDTLELQTFLGMANYLSRYTANLATKTAVLRDLTKKESVFVWGPEHQKAFDSVKETIATAATLAYFDSSKPVIIQTDASKRGVGATLLQDGRPVAYASKSLTETESNYCNIEREMLAIVFGLERFHHYAYGRHVTIESNHTPIESITRKPLINAPPRLMRMLLRIQKYDFTVKYVPGKDIPIADGLSRLPIQGDEIPDIDVTIHDITGVSESRLEKIKDETKCDETLQVLARTVTNGWPQYRNQCPDNIAPFWNFRDEIVVFSGVLLKGNRVIIPKNMQAEILVKIHTGHQGIEKCRLRARETVYWCGDIDNMIRKCDVCQHNQTAQPKEEMIPIDATYPWEMVGSDMFHFRGDEYLLVVDYYSSYPIIRKLSSTTSCAVVSKLKLIFSEFGIPNFFISDNARQYDSAEFRKFEAEYDFKHETSSPRYPQCNGKSERFVGIVKKILQKAYEAREDPAIALLCLIRTTPIETGLPSPAEMMFDRKIQSNLPTVNIAEKDKACRREQWKRQYNERSHTLKDLNRGQCVRVQDYTAKKWEPAVINQKLSQPRSYMLPS